MKIRGEFTKTVEVDVPYYTMIDTVVDRTREEFVRRSNMPAGSSIHPETEHWGRETPEHGVEVFRRATTVEKQRMALLRDFAEFSGAILRQTEG